VNANDGTVSTIDLASGTVRAPIKVGTTAAYVALVPSPAVSVPVFSSPGKATFQPGQASSVQVQATGATALTERGALPQGVTFKDNGDGTATLSGTPGAATLGAYRIQITATGASGISTQSFLLNVVQLAAITSADSGQLMVGGAGSLTVKTTGFPTPAVTKS